MSSYNRQIELDRLGESNEVQDLQAIGSLDIIYKVIVDDGNYLEIRDETIFRDHYREYIKMIKSDSWRLERQKIIDINTLQKDKDLSEMRIF